MNQKIKIKVTLLGESTAGKTTIAQRLLKKPFMDNPSTIGANFNLINVDNKFNMELWDTAGQERYNALLKIYYRKSNVFLLVYDASTIDLNNFSRIPDYINNIINEFEHQDYKIYIIGNKIDMVMKGNNMNIEKLIRQKLLNVDNSFYDKITYYYLSAKTGEGFDIFCEDLFQCCEGYYQKIVEKLGNQSETVVVINKEEGLIANAFDKFKCGC